MNEFLEQFLLESRELVEQATVDLLALEKAPEDKAHLDSAFRAFHTLKGGAGIVDFDAMAHAVHAAEDALAAARTGTRPITMSVVGDCFACVDQVTQWLDIIQSTGELPAHAQAEAAVIVEHFDALSRSALLEAEHHDPATKKTSADTEGGLSPQAHDVLKAQLGLLDETGAHAIPARFASAGKAAANVLRSAGRVGDVGAIDRATAASVAANSPAPLREAIQTTLSKAQQAAVRPSAPQPEHESQARTLRVEAARIDALVNLAAELTVAKNSIGHAVKLAQEGDPALAGSLKHRFGVLDRLTGELQRTVLAMRVLPLRHVFQRFPRLLREMSRELGKPADLRTEGAETEADKAIVEMLFEPLLHVVRNALSHGIEDPATRAKERKPPVATILMRASRQGEHVVVEVSDDGQGIDVAKVRRTALERKMISGELLSAMSDAEVIELVFEPGFSTAAEVTGLSGRGVGMDAVRAAVRRIAGHVGVESRPGQGTTVRFTLPFSVMLSRVMLVGAGGQTFGIPLDAVVETLRAELNRIVPVGAGQAIVLRGRTVPVVELSAALGLAGNARAETQATLVVTRTEGQYGALRVDRIGEPMEVMLKPLDGLLAGMRGLAGSTLLGDGSVLLILDLVELFQ